MVHAGADIEAFLKLDASGFKTGIETATEALDKLKATATKIDASVKVIERFKTAIIEIGSESGKFETGLRAISLIVDRMIPKFTAFGESMTKNIQNFKTFASAMENLATAAQRMTTVAERGTIGIEALESVISAFTTGVSSAEITVTGLTNALRNLANQSNTSSSSIKGNNEQVNVSFKTIQNDLQAMQTAIYRYGTVMSDTEARVIYQTQLMKNEYRNARRELLEFANGGVEAFNKIPVAQQKVKAQMEQMKVEFEKAKSELLNLAETGVEAFNKIQTKINTLNSTINSGVSRINSYRVALQGLTTTTASYGSTLTGVNTTMSTTVPTQANMSRSIQNTTNSINAQRSSASTLTSSITTLSNNSSILGKKEKEVASATNSATSSIQRQSSAMSSATARTNQMATATNGLKRALSSLRMIGTMVASMLAYNFAHKLLVATGETIHAKSEMEGYFKMLHFGQSDIDSFNQALDRTVAQFQRVNKYSLGETISSIGVEFNLTTQEMEKAMKVTSMITSEYLRAGRNANEASLAVKDVLQGQFQRLSRETGVKGEQLKEAGWSGDTTDVLGLMEALEKVGESRNWDVFAEKANSLNDILVILQNRFGEWSAEMVNTIQPSIVSAFNAIMSVGGALSGVLSGLWQWINGEGLVESAVRWTAIATAITTVVGALVSYRTGAGLVQMAQMGLRGSIMATIFSLKAEEVATYGSRNALIAKITSLKAEQVATLGVRTAILTKILGLKAETVATMGLKNALAEEVVARRIQEATMKGATAQQKMMIYTEFEEQMAKRGTLSTIIAKIAGVEMETFAERGLIVALAQRIAQTPLYIGALKAEEVAELSTAEAAQILAMSLAPITAILIAVAAALYMLIAPLQQASEEMKQFNDLLNNGEDIVKSYGRIVDNLKNKQSELEKQQSELTAGTKEYINKQKEIERVSKDVTTAEKNKALAYEAYQKTVSANAKFQERRDEIAIHNQTLLAEAYEKVGISAEEALRETNHEMIVAEQGAKQLREALARIKWEADRGFEKQQKTIDMLDQYGLSDEKIKEYGTRLSEANYKIREGFEKFMTSDDLMERIGGWFEIQQGRLEQWWAEFEALFEVRDWEGIRDKLIEGLKYILTGFGAFDWIGTIGKAVGEKGIVGVIMDALFGEGDSDGILDIISDWGNSMIAEPLLNWINWFIKDPFGNTDKIMDDLSTSVGKLLFGKDSPSIRTLVDQWFNNNVVKPILDWINGFASNPLSYIGNGLMTGLGWFLDPFVKMLFGDEASATESIKEIINHIFSIDWGQAIMDALTSGGEGGGGATTAKKIDTTALLSALLGLTDGMDFSWATEWLNTNIITPLQNAFSMFMADPMSFIMGGIVFTIDSFLNALFPSDGGVGIVGWVETNIVQPMSNAISTGIASIPIVGDILSLFGLVNGDNTGASQKGSDIGTAFKTKVEDVIRSIPILGDVLQMLGVIPNANPDAHAKGQGVGENIKQGEQQGHTGTSQNVASEMSDVVRAISNAVGEAYKVAQQVGNAIWNGINSILQRASPGFIHDQVDAEFGTDIPNAILSSKDLAYTNAQTYGQAISDGISSVNMNTLGMDAMASEYQDDALMISTSTQMIGTDTTTAFNDMQMAVNTTTANMSGNVTTTYTGMQTKQASLLNTMKTQNQTAYNDMYTKSNQSLIQMRDSTSNITNQMVNAWSHMKDQIVATANRLKSESTSHFNQLSNTIGTFYRKIQNPSNWGSGSKTPSNVSARTSRNPSIGKSFAKGISTRTSFHGAGGSSRYSGSSTMSIAQLKKMLCPNGECGSLFDGYSATDRVDVEEFLSSITGEHGIGGWSGWNTTHYKYIKDKSDQWDMKSPVINLVGGIPTNSKFKVGDFENGTPKISFDSFQSMAEAIFSRIPYKLYYDSSWKGSWLGALQAGACNCSDGADALIAFARTCGFDGYKQHGYWGSTGHYWAVINGKVMDTTAWQDGYGWRSPKVSYGHPNVRRAMHNPSEPNPNNTGVNIYITMRDVYGIDDLNTKIEDGIDKGLQKHFNNNYTIGAV